MRCSRCKHAFFLPNPSVSQSQVVHSVAEDAAGGGLAAGVPPVAEELDSSGSTLAGPSAVVPEAVPESEEEDWQFSEEVRIEGDDLDDDLDDPLAGGSEANSNLDSGSDFGAAGDFGGGLDADALLQDIGSEDLETPDLPGPGIESAAAEDAGVGSGLDLDVASDSVPSELPRDESSFGTVDDFSSLMEDEESPGLDLAAEISAELDQEAASECESGSQNAAKGTTDDLGDPESWDLVGSNEFDASRRSVMGVARSYADPLGEGGAQVGGLFGEDSQSVAYPEEIAEASQVKRVLAGSGRIAGWVVTVAAVAMVLWLGLRSEWTRWAQSPQVVSVGPFTAETGAAGWVDTSRAGFVLVVEGRARNTGNAAIWPGPVRLALLDAAGERLAGAEIRAGASLPDATLRESSPAQLEASVALAAERFAGTPLAAGEVRSFQAIVSETRLPEQARRVLLEVGEAAERPEPAVAGRGGASNPPVAAQATQLDEVSLPSP